MIKRTPDQIIAHLAAGQHGVVTREQLLAAGLSRHAIDHRLRSGRLRAIHRGLYGAGPIPTAREREMAAVLAAGRLACISHRSAAGLWGIMARPGARDPVELTTRGPCRVRPGLRVHRSRTLTRADVTRLEGIPTTQPERTLLDVATVCGGRDLERAIAETLARRLTTRRRLEGVLRRVAGQPGAPALAAILEAGDPARTRSEAEELFLALVRRADLPTPQVNVEVAGHRVDFYWAAERLIVEVDGFAYHSSGQAMDRDRGRDADLVAAGIAVMRVTYQQIKDESDAVLAGLVRALVARGSQWVPS